MGACGDAVDYLRGLVNNLMVASPDVHEYLTHSNKDYMRVQVGGCAPSQIDLVIAGNF